LFFCLFGFSHQSFVWEEIVIRGKK
jgi:hypothetical protein